MASFFILAQQGKKCTRINVVFRLIKILLKKQNQSFKSALWELVFLNSIVQNFFLITRLKSILESEYQSGATTNMSNLFQIIVRDVILNKKSTLKLAVQLLFKNIIKVWMVWTVISLYQTTTKCNRWYMKVLFHSISTSYISTWYLSYISTWFLY